MNFQLKSVLLPFFGALGGIIIPAGPFMLLNYGSETQSGAGIPMATDIAFALGILSLLGSRVPASTDSEVLTASSVLTSFKTFPQALLRQAFYADFFHDTMRV